MITKKIRVSKRSIREGKQGASDSCPIALAIRKAVKLNDNQVISVDEDEIVINEIVDRGAYTIHRPVYTMTTPAKVAKFIFQFDDTNVDDQLWNRINKEKVYTKKGMKPINFVLKLESVAD